MGVLKQALLHLFYAPRCLHCTEGLENIELHLCETCQESLELASVHDRCPRCFSFWRGGRCEVCRHLAPSWIKGAFAFEEIGPPASLIFRLRSGREPYLAKSVASFMVTQWARLDWPLPDAIVPVPKTWLHRLQQGEHSSVLIAKEISCLMNVGMIRALKQSFSEELYYLNNQALREKKVVLLVNDRWEGGTSLKAAAEAFFPSESWALFVLTFC